MKDKTTIQKRLEVIEGILNEGNYKTNIDKIKIEVGINTLKWVLGEVV